MASGFQILNRLRSIDFSKAAADSLHENEIAYIDILKRQLWMGKGSDGNDLSPGYLEDPYFKSREAAQRYLNWKKKITPGSGRNPNAPNLFITGLYYGSLSAKSDLSGLSISSSASFGIDIETKYKGRANILGGPFRKEFIFDIARPSFLKNIEKIMQ